MNKKIAQIIWIVIIISFSILQVYNYLKGNYFDLLTTILVFLIFFMLLVVIYLIRKRN